MSTYNPDNNPEIHSASFPTNPHTRSPSSKNLQPQTRPQTTTPMPARTPFARSPSPSPDRSPTPPANPVFTLLSSPYYTNLLTHQETHFTAKRQLLDNIHSLYLAHIEEISSQPHHGRGGTGRGTGRGRISKAPTESSPKSKRPQKQTQSIPAPSPQAQINTQIQTLTTKHEQFIRERTTLLQRWAEDVGVRHPAGKALGEVVSEMRRQAQTPTQGEGVMGTNRDMNMRDLDGILLVVQMRCME